MNEKFYTFETKVGYRNQAVVIEPISEYEELELINENSPLLTNRDYVVKKGRIWADFIGFETSFLFAISNRVKEYIENKGLKGLKLFPINIINQPDKEYYCFYHTHKAGKITNLARNLNGKDDNVKFDIKKWNGNDFFTLEETLLNICREDFAQEFSKKKYKNIEINPL